MLEFKEKTISGDVELERDRRKKTFAAMITLFWSAKTIEGRWSRRPTMVQVTQQTARNFEFHIRHR